MALLDPQTLPEKPLSFLETAKNICWGDKILQNQLFLIVLLQMMKKSKEDWVVYGKEKRKSLVFYQQNVLDLTHFAAIHPGGKKVIEPYIFQDVTDNLFTIYPHKKETTLALLNRYIVGENITQEKDKKGKKQNMLALVQESQQKKRVCFSKTIVYNAEKKSVAAERTPNSAEKVRNPDKKSTKSSCQRSKPKKCSRFDVSIKLISDALAEEKRNTIIIVERQKTEQLDGNVLEQQLDEDNQISNMPVLRVRHLNRQRIANQF